MTSQQNQYVVSDEAEQQVRKKTLASWIAEARVMERVVVTLSQGFNYLLERQLQNDVELLTQVLIANAINALRCSLNLLLKGYYVQGTTLIRTVHESRLVVNYIKVKPQEAGLFLENSKRAPSFSQIRQELDNIFPMPQEPFSKWTSGWYSLMSTSAHPLHGMVVALTNRGSEGPKVHYGPHYDNRFLAYVYLFLQEGMLMLATLADIVNDQRLDVEGLWERDRNALQQKVLGWIDRFKQAIDQAMGDLE